MELKSKVDAALQTTVETPPPPAGWLNRSLSRQELTVILNWAFRIFIVLLSVYLLSQGTKWVSAFVFGCGFAAVGIGVYLTFRVLNFPDLTIEGSYTLGAAITVNLIFNQSGTWLGNPWLATALATIGGGLAGLATGLLHTRLKINGLLASILVTTGLYSVNLHILAPTAVINIGGKPNIVESFVEPYKSIFQPERIDGITREWLKLGFLALLAVGLIMIFNWFLNTQLGLALRATGDNEIMIRAQGVNTDRAKLLLLVISNAMFGLAGALIAQYLQYADGQFGLGMIVIGLAAVILGESFIAPVTTLMALSGTLVGAIIYRVLFTGVFGLEVSWGLLLRVTVTLLVMAGLASLVFLTIKSRTSALISLACIALGAALVAVFSSWFDAMARGAFSTNLDQALIFKAEQYDIRLVLSVLIVIAMGVPALRSRIGMRALRVVTGK